MSTPSIIFRIDDRLIHGQVLVGWASYYPVKHIVIGNDEISQNEWEKDLLMMVASPSIDVQVLNIEETTTYINTHLNDKEVSMVLISALQDIEKMAAYGLKLKRINVGGIHYSEGRKEYLPYLFLSDQEVNTFKSLLNKGFQFQCLDIPTSTSYDLAAILEKH